MNFAELLLRLGCALVGWLVVFTHFLWLATTRSVTCGSDGDELWRLLLGFAPIAIGFALLLPLSRRIKTVHGYLRYGAVPVLLFTPLALAGIWKTFAEVNLGGAGICADLPSAWHAWWAPLQMVAVAILLLCVARAWRAAPLPP